MRETVRLYLGFLLLGILCLFVTLLALPMRVLLVRALRKRMGRQLVSACTRAYLRSLARMGACQFDLSALDALRNAPAMVIAPNHPSLLDALMVLSRLPGATCIMKTDIVNNVFVGVGARQAGYICNTPLRTMVQLAMDDLQQGNHVLLFPEGTRTSTRPISSIQGTVGLIAKNAGVPVQTVFIETRSGFLGKGWSWHWVPQMPMGYRIRLGARFAPPTDTAAFTTELETYFHSALAQADLPSFPIAKPSSASTP